MTSAVGEPLLSNEDGTARTLLPVKHRRLASLDIVRGFTVALMIFVDDVSLQTTPTNPHTSSDPI